MGGAEVEPRREALAWALPRLQDELAGSEVGFTSSKPSERRQGGVVVLAEPRQARLPRSRPRL